MHMSSQNDEVPSSQSSLSSLSNGSFSKKAKKEGKAQKKALAAGEEAKQKPKKETKPQQIKDDEPASKPSNKQSGAPKLLLKDNQPVLKSSEQKPKLLNSVSNKKSPVNPLEEYKAAA